METLSHGAVNPSGSDSPQLAAIQPRAKYKIPRPLAAGIFNHPTTTTPKVSGWTLLLSLVLNAGVFSSFIFLFSPTLSWIFGQIAAADNILHIIAFSLLVFLSVRVLSDYTKYFHQDFEFSVAPFWVMFTGCTGYLLNEYITGINIFSATLMLISAYGVLGFYLRRKYWTNASLILVLLILILPFEGYLDIYLGFPLRLFSADIAENMLKGFGIHTLSRESILLIENKAAVIDLDCSGLKGLWAGLIFYIVMTGVERKSLNAGWLAGLLGFLSSLILFNIFRIVALVWLVLVMDQTRLAHFAHTTLGVLGFVISCLLGWGLLKLQKSRSQTIQADQEELPQVSLHLRQLIKVKQFPGMVWVIAAFWFCIALYKPFPKTDNIIYSELAYLNQNFAGNPVPLSTKEQSFFSSNAAQAAKFQLDWRGQNISLLFVFSQYWKSQHDPRNCYTAQGYVLDNQTTLRINQPAKNDDLEVKSLVLNGGGLQGLYWYQSPMTQTADYTERMFSGWRSPEVPWVMVSMAWEGNMADEELESLVFQLNQHIDHTFTATQIRHQPRI